MKKSTLKKSLTLAGAVFAAKAMVACGPKPEGSKVAEKSTAASNAKGSCYGIVGAHEGECGGKDPVSGESWECAGNNPTANAGWKTMTAAECEAAPKHADATEKRFVPDPA